VPKTPQGYRRQTEEAKARGKRREAVPPPNSILFLLFSSLEFSPA